MKTTQIEIVRYSRRLVTDKPESTAEDDRLTIDLTAEPFEEDAGRLESCRVIEQHKSSLISRLRDFLRRRSADERV